MPGYKLGKLPARADAVAIKFADVFNAKKLPTPPKVFGHQWKVKQWNMLANDQYGCCVWAGAAHETMLWTAEGGAPVAPFTAKAVLADYAAVTGFNPQDPMTDQGTDMAAAASYRRKTGVLDAKGQRHKVDSYVALKAGRVDELILAMWLTGAAGIGLELPNNAETLFDSRRPWAVTPGTEIDGGHYVSGVGRNAAGNILVVTWGRLQEMTPDFYHRYCDEAIVYLSLESLKNNLSPEGFDLSALRQHISHLT